MNMQELLDRLEEEQRDFPERYQQRIAAWRLKVTGYSYLEIAEHLDISVSTVYGHIRWVQKNVPAAIESAEDFRHIGLQRLEEQYQLLSPGRIKGEEGALKLSQNILDMQAKLLGAYTQKIDVTQQVNYTVDGVDVDKA